jgi:hypothetical protein
MEDSMHRRCKQALVCASALASLSVIAPASIDAQGLRQVSAAEMQRAQEAFAQDQRSAALREQITQDKGAVIADITARWAPQMGQTEKSAVGWSNALGAASPEKLFQIAQASTWDGVIAAQLGTTPDALGSVTSDLVFTPLTPCRVLDTRLGDPPYRGPYNVGDNISFAVTDPINSAGKNQGGAANCGFPYLSGTGVALNITAVPVGAGGDLRIFPVGGTPPSASIINFQSGINIANAANVAIAYGAGGNDVTINVEFGTGVYIVADILGYFAPPVATAVQTQRVVTTNNAVGAGQWSIDSPACPTGYSLVGGGYNDRGPGLTGNWIYGSHPDPATNPSTQWRAYGNNTTGSTEAIDVYAICARVPGR